MKRVFIFPFLIITIFAKAQFSQAERNSINKGNQADYQLILDQLGIPRSQLRPGASGNPKDANAANRSEDKVNKYIQPRKPDDWGASRVIDFMETDKDVDAKRIGIERISRYVKAAVIAMAYDSRISLAFRQHAEDIVRAEFSAHPHANYQDISVASFLPYSTTASKNAEQGTAVSAVSNSITYTLPAGSITTLVEQ